MNKVILMGRLTRDPEVRYSQGDNPMAIARYTLLTADSDVTTTESRQLTLSDALLSEEVQNLLRNISVRD